MPILVVFLLMVAAAALGYAIVVNAAHNAIARGASPDATALRLLPEAVRRHAHERLLPGFAFQPAPLRAREARAPRHSARAPEYVDEVAPQRRSVARSRADMRAGRAALHRAARADSPLYMRAFALVRWGALLLLVTLALSASMWLLLSYVWSILSRAIRA
jgi:hypothetical protein